MKNNNLVLNENEELIKWMRTVFNDKNSWPKSYPALVESLSIEDNKVQEKALFIIGEIGLKYPSIIEEKVFQKILILMKNDQAKIRERAVGALGRIGRGDANKVEEYIPQLLALAQDIDENVRMNVIWASENIATNNPSLFENDMDVFAKLLDDDSEKVRMEAPEIFRVMGKKDSNYICSYKSKLEKISQEDKNRVVRVHAQGALETIKA